MKKSQKDFVTCRKRAGGSKFRRAISQRARTVGIPDTLGKPRYVKYYSVRYRINYSLYVLSTAKSSPVLYLAVNIYQVTLKKREYLKWLKTP